MMMYAGLPTEPIERIEMQQKGLYPMLGMRQEDSFVVIRVAQVWDENRAVRRNHSVSPFPGRICSFYSRLFFRCSKSTHG